MPELLERARDVIAECGVRNVSLMLGDGTLGWRAHAPYDAILVSAAAPDVPAPLLEQLADGGRMIVPIGDMEVQMLAMITRDGDRVERRDIAPVRFVPLWGTHGWSG